MPVVLWDFSFFISLWSFPISEVFFSVMNEFIAAVDYLNHISGTQIKTAGRSPVGGFFKKMRATGDI